LFVYNGYKGLKRIHHPLVPIRFRLQALNLRPRKIPHRQERQGPLPRLLGLTGCICDVRAAVKWWKLPWA
jgi:hypothetical protein